MPSTTTPNQVPSFLNTILPNVAQTLLALDISCNFLASIPPALASCTALEELNIASNPLRVIPVWLSSLTRLQVLIADSTLITTLPSSLASLTSIRTLSLRRNRMYSLPSWLCLLTNIEWLLVDGNPFQGPWKSLVDPLLEPMPVTPAYMPNTPFSAVSMMTMTSDGSMGSPNSAGVNGRQDGMGEFGVYGGGNDHTITTHSSNSVYGYPGSALHSTTSFSSSAQNHNTYPSSHTPLSTPGSVTGSLSNANSRAPSMVNEFGSASYFPPPASRGEKPERPPQRMRSSPVGRPRTHAGTGSRRTYADGDQNDKLSVPNNTSRSRSREQEPPSPLPGPTTMPSEEKLKTLKKMKSADEMRRNRAGSVSAAMAAAAGYMSNATGMGKSHTEVIPSVPLPTMPSPLPSPNPAVMTPLPPSRAPSVVNYIPNSTHTPNSTHVSSSGEISPERPGAKRFVSLGPRGATGSMFGTPSPSGSPMHPRKPLTPTLWGESGQMHPDSVQEGSVDQEAPVSDTRRVAPTTPEGTRTSRAQTVSMAERFDAVTGRDKGGKKWGFLKKMSMGKMKSSTPADRSPPSSRTQPMQALPKRPSTAHSTTAPADLLPRIMKPPSTGLGITTQGPSIGVSITPSDSTTSLAGGVTPTPSLSRAAGSSGSLNLLAEMPGLLKPQPSLDVMNLNSPPMLAPPSPNVRAGRRRSFLPIDTPPVLNIPIPKSPFLTGAIAVGGTTDMDDDPVSSPLPCIPQTPDLTNEMDAAMPPHNENYARALRSVMAYLRDLSDLAPTAAPVTSGASTPQPSEVGSQTTSPGTRSRRPTMIGGQEPPSDPSTPSTGQLRSVKSSASLRGGTMSIFTTDSGNGEDRKYKDDKAKRAHLVHEIVEYVYFGYLKCRMLD